MYWKIAVQIRQIYITQTHTIYAKPCCCKAIKKLLIWQTNSLYCKPIKWQLKYWIYKILFGLFWRHLYIVYKSEKLFIS